MKITDESDILIGDPLERDTIRAVETGTLVTCNDHSCGWQGLFPTAELAKDAVETHHDREPRWHTDRYTIVRLLDEATAQTVDESRLGLAVEELRARAADGTVREFEFPRTTEDVDAIVQRGDLIERPPDREGVVANVTKTRSYGLPTWTVVYVERDVDLEAATRDDYRWKNELIAQDGDVYYSYGEAPLAAPAFDVVGEAEHQASLERFNRGASA